MASARITINAVEASDDDVPLATLVQLNNVNTGGESTYTWSFQDKPTGSAASLSATNIQNPTFTPDVEGTYLLKLVVNQGTGTEVSDTKIAAVRHLRTGLRMPAAGETDENGAKGWHTAMEGWLDGIQDLTTDSGTIVAKAGAGTLARGTVVRINATSDLANGEYVAYGAGLSNGLLPNAIQYFLGISEGHANGSGSTPAIGDPVRIRLRGVLRSVTVTGGGSVPSPVFATAGGALVNTLASFTPGTNTPIMVGKLLRNVSGTTFDIWVDTLAPYQRVQHIFHFASTTANTTAYYVSPGYWASAPSLTNSFSIPLSGVGSAVAPALLGPVVMSARTGPATSGYNVNISVAGGTSRVTTMAAAATSANSNYISLSSWGTSYTISVQGVAGITTGPVDLVVAVSWFIPPWID